MRKLPWWVIPLSIGCIFMNFLYEDTRLMSITVILFLLISVIGYARWFKDYFKDE